MENRDLKPGKFSSCVCCLSEDQSHPRRLLQYIHVLRDVLRLKIYSSMDSVICQKCVRQLKRINKFRSKVKTTQSFIKLNNKTGDHGRMVVNQISETIVNPGMDPEFVAEETREMKIDPSITEQGGGAVCIDSVQVSTVIDAKEAASAALPDGGEGFEEVWNEAFQNEHERTCNESSISQETEQIKDEGRRPNFISSDDRTCPVCRQHFTFFKELINHMSVHYSKRICFKTSKLYSPRQQSLDNYKLSYSSAIHRCTHCGNLYKKPSTLKEHIRTAHKGEKKIYKCLECSESFQTYHGRRLHSIDVHHHEKKKYKCSECPKRYNHSSHLHAHIRSEHRNEKNVMCELCSYMFFSKAALNKHMVSHSQERKYKCGHCSKTYPRRSSLRQHLKIHTDEKAFVCAVCGRAFTQKITLKKHAATHKSKSSDSVSDLSTMLQKL